MSVPPDETTSLEYDKSAPMDAQLSLCDIETSARNLSP